jgi:hypothetical protein
MTLSMPGSPMSWMASALASSHRRPATEAASTAGVATMFVTGLLASWIGSWTDDV